MKLRAHHGMCLSFFRGKGYSEGFTAHMAKIKEELESDPAQLIEIVQTMDVICVACPHNKQGVCDTQEKVERYDAAVLRYYLGHSDKTPPDTPEETKKTPAEVLRMPYQTYASLVKERILDAGIRESICGDCVWNEVCR